MPNNRLGLRPTGGAIGPAVRWRMPHSALEACLGKLEGLRPVRAAFLKSQIDSEHNHAMGKSTGCQQVLRYHKQSMLPHNAAP